MQRRIAAAKRLSGLGGKDWSDMTMRLTIRIDFAAGDALGPGKIGLLERVGETGSIRGAASAMKMSYRRAWLLLKAVEKTFGARLIQTATGGKSGGGTDLTALGRRVVRHYRAVEQSAAKASNRHLVALDRARRHAGVRGKAR